MSKKFLVGLDGSTLAESVLPYAETLARATDATLVLTRVVPPTVDPGIDPGLVVAAIADAEAYLAAVARRIPARGKPIAIETAVTAGYPAETLLEESQLRHCDLILLTTHGRSGLGRLLYGSVAESVLARSDVPVLLVRASGGIADQAPHAALPRLLVPLDGSRFAEAALPVASDLARALASELQVIRVVPPPTAWSRAESDGVQSVAEEAADEDEYAAAEYLDFVVESLRGGGIHATRAVWVDRPAPGIAAAATALGSELIVMATHGRTGLARALLGSVALAVLHHVGVPILFVRPPRSDGTSWDPDRVLAEA